VELGPTMATRGDPSGPACLRLPHNPKKFGEEGGNPTSDEPRSSCGIATRGYLSTIAIYRWQKGNYRPFGVDFQ
jgi:hypothetical protein